jgi:hypothetical protein
VCTILFDPVITDGGLATHVLEPIFKFDWHHSLALRMATNFCVNVIYYGYAYARLALAP